MPHTYERRTDRSLSKRNVKGFHEFERPIDHSHNVHVQVQQYVGFFSLSVFRKAHLSFVLLYSSLMLFPFHSRTLNHKKISICLYVRNTKSGKILTHSYTCRLRFVHVRPPFGILDRFSICVIFRSTGGCRQNHLQIHKYVLFLR